MSIRPVIIVKVGTGVLTYDDGTLNTDIISTLSAHLAELKKEGRSVILVSSGAVGAGVPLMGLEHYPEDIGTRQAAAAIGQAQLMKHYQEACAEHGITVAQILLSSYDLKEETHRGHAQAVLKRLLDTEQIIPVVNENDVVSLRELTKTDNDMLAANLCSILHADTLILLTSVDGILDGEKKVISRITDVTEARSLVTGDSGKFSIGGMDSKLDAVEVALAAQAQVIIGNGSHPERLVGYLDKSSTGTYFY